MNLKATGEQIVILPDPPIERTESGIIIPVEARDKRNSGVVVSLVPDHGILCQTDKGTMALGAITVSKDVYISEGDRVVFNYRQGYEVEHEGTVYLSIHKDLIAGKL